MLEHCTVSENSADIGGGAYQSDLSDCTLMKNEAKGYKAWHLAFRNGRRRCLSILTDCTVAENKAISGGAP